MIGFVQARVLVHDTALHLRANKTFTDIYGQRHKAGEEWLVTSTTSPSHICDVFETEVGLVYVRPVRPTATSYTERRRVKKFTFTPRCPSLLCVWVFWRGVRACA